MNSRVLLSLASASCSSLVDHMQSLMRSTLRMARRSQVVRAIPILAAASAVLSLPRAARLDGGATSDDQHALVLPRADARGDEDLEFIKGLISDLTSSMANSSARIWGSLAEPKFTVQANKKFASRETFAGSVEEKIAFLTEKLSELRADMRTLGELESTSSAETPSSEKLRDLAAKYKVDAEAPSRERLTIISVRPRSYLRTLEVPSPSTKLMTEDELREKYGPGEAFARSLFMELTGQALPEPLRVTETDAMDIDHAGEASEYTNEARVRPADYLSWVGTCEHEFGHFCGRTHEAVIEREPALAESFEVTAREEGVAILFADCAGRLVEDSDDRQILIGRLDQWAEAYYREGFESDHAAHALGGAMADAALTLCAEPAEAYRMLSTGYKLDEKIARLVAHTKERARVFYEMDEEALAVYERNRYRIRGLLKSR